MLINVKVLSQPKINIKLSSIQKIKVNTIPQNQVNIKANDSKILIGGDSFPLYTGKYKVIPKAFEQSILHTEKKLLDKNIVVDKVPYYETSNEFGNTVYIGAEMEIE